MDDFFVWYKQYPVVTRTYLTCIIVTTALFSTGAVNVYNLIFSAD